MTQTFSYFLSKIQNKQLSHSPYFLMSPPIDIRRSKENSSEENNNTYISLSPEERAIKTAKLLNRLDGLRSKIKNKEKIDVRSL